jgi:hypothetical protein
MIVVLAVVLVAATGASAVTMRLTGRHAPAHGLAGQLKAHHVASSLELPPAPPPAAPAPDATSTGNGDAARGSATVPRAKHLVVATMLVTRRTPFSPRELGAIRHLSSVSAVRTVAAGRAVVDGHRAFVLGVNPGLFRPWTPKLTAASQPLWESIARGELTASFDMGHQAKLPLGATVPVRAKSVVPMRIGAFASVGMSGVDAVMSGRQAAALGLRDRTGVVISAPKADLLQLRGQVMSKLRPGLHAHAWLLREVIVIRDAGEFLTRLQINRVLHAAASRVGKPYVWGATGPNAFDCSGLVQWSFALAGIRMPRVSEQQWFAGPHVAYSSARPGDLLFWTYDPTDPSNVDHVAIYAGQGMMLVAPHTGAYVEYVPVPLAHMAGVVRVDPAMAAQIA